jgi:hypothetical protein
MLNIILSERKMLIIQNNHNNNNFIFILRKTKSSRWVRLICKYGLVIRQK